MFVSHLVVCGLLAQIPPAAQLPKPPVRQQGAPSNADRATPAHAAPEAAAAEAGGQAPPFDQIPPAANESTPAQQPPADRTAEPAAAQPPADTPLVPVEPRALRLTALEVLNAALAVPEGEKVRGRPLTLVDALRSVADRAAQLRVTEIYWRLAEALADYNFTWDESQQLERLKPAAAPEQRLTPEQHVLATRLAGAKARLQDAELALVAAQFDLAGAIRLPAGQPLPLPADVPHVGPYRTVLDQVYAGRAIPARAVLIDRTLPIRRGAIDARAAAIQAATDAITAAEEEHFEGRGDLSLVLTLIDELSRQRRAFLSDVRTYNYEIAEYAMAAPTPAMDPQGLASMLIKPSGGAVAGAAAGGAPASPGLPGGVERAGFTEPLGSIPAAPLRPIAEDRIRLGPPPAYPQAAAGKEPTPAPPNPKQPATGSGPKSPPARGANGAAPRSQPPPAQAPPADSAARGKPLEVRRPMVNAPPSTSTGDDVIASHRLYPALHDMAPAEQARHLATVLSWEPATEDAVSAPIGLADYLTAIPSDRRNEALTAYWHAQFHAARAQTLSQQLEQFEALGAAIAGRPRGGADDIRAAAMLLVRAAHRAAEADARSAQADRLAAQWTLTIAAGRPLSGGWLAAETPPHAGGYRLQLNELSPELLDSSVVQRLSNTIPQLRRTFVERAAAVVAADESRAARVAEPGASLAETQQALTAIAEQTRETIAFLARLADYNVEIGAYANAVLPPATTSQSLARALVVTPATPARAP